MIFDAVPYSQTLRHSDIKSRALEALSDFLEKSLGVRVVKDLRSISYGRPDLTEPLQLAALLEKHGVIKSFGPLAHYSPDEPRMKGWYAVCNDPTNHQVGGSTWESDQRALYATLSEALERYIWFTQCDYFVRPKRATEVEMRTIGDYISPKTFAGFSDEQRSHHPERVLRPEAEYLWTQGVSTVSGKHVYIPAQLVTGVDRNRFPDAKKEPLIRQQNTNGLATWPTQNGARVAGALELIEREAYMIMWLNQITLPRIALAPLCAAHPSLARVIAKSEQYQFKVHAIRLLTDAPTHAIAVVVEDISGNAPRFSVGLAAHWSLPHAFEKALTEAFRSYRRYRYWASKGNTWDMGTPVGKIGHLDRNFYWGVPEHAKHLEFMIAGHETTIEDAPWDSDTIDTHYRRIVQWCKEKNFEYISVPLTKSAKNPTNLHIEIAVIPQLHPTYLNESGQQFGGDRWHSVPQSLGLTPRQKPFADRPHPFS